MEELRILMLCCSRFAYPAMQQLAYFKQLSAVIIPSHCKEMIEETQQALQQAGVPVIIATKREFEKQVKDVIDKYNINMGVVLTFSYIIPPSVFNMPAKGFYNFHPGLLPAYRGADPIFHQIKNREKFTGVTVHKIDEGADTGEIVLLEKMQLMQEDTYGVLAEKLAQLSAKLLGTLTKILSLGFTAPSKPQDENKAVYYPEQTLPELAIDWKSMDAMAIVALINACNPHNKGAATKINNKMIRVLCAENYGSEATIHPSAGTVITIEDDYMEVATINNQILKINFLSMDEGFLPPYYLRQLGLIPGMCFENIF